MRVALVHDWLIGQRGGEQVLLEFNRQAFHDFLLSQGLLPPRLMRQAVLEEFVKKEAGS